MSAGLVWGLVICWLNPAFLVFESPVVWTKKRPKPNQVGLFATGLSVAVAEGLGKWQLQSVPDPENSQTSKRPTATGLNQTVQTFSCRWIAVDHGFHWPRSSMFKNNTSY